MFHSFKRMSFRLAQAPAADSGTGDLPAISTPEHWAEAVVVSHTTAEPHDGGSEEHRGPKRSRTSDDGEVRPHLCQEAPALHRHAQLAPRALAPGAQRSQVPQVCVRFEGPAGLQLGPQDGCSPRLRSPLAQVDAVDERERERQRWSAWLAAFIKDSPEPVTAMFRARATAAALAFPDRHISSFAARVAAAALPFLERHAGGSSGGAFDSLRSPPLSLPLNLPAATSTPLFAFFAEVCPRQCQSAPA
jgi:hypothetical protein